ncbi:MAG: acyl-CoA dehydrogenase [Actinobacteria bacterium]|nr:acyl-CoA dehydrogenase [Actinomycetota bacterium]
MGARCRSPTAGSPPTTPGTRPGRPPRLRSQSGPRRDATPPASWTDARVRYRLAVQFELSADQEALRDAATSLLDARSAPEAVRNVVDNGGGWDRSLWGELVEQGWAAVVVPEDLGGLGLGWVEGAVLMEAVGAHVAPVPILGQLVALDAVARAGETDWLERLLAGDAIAAVTHRPLPASGSTVPVPYLLSADVLVAPTDAGRLVLVDLEGAEVEALPAMDLTRELGRLDVDSLTRVDLGGPDAIEAFLDAGAVAVSAELLGAAARCLDDTVAYARDRVQFGRPIGSFQAVKHRCADMLVDVEGMRSTTWWAAWCLAAQDPERSVAASTAKIWTSDAADRVLNSALQVHGGIGFTWECDVHLYLKRVQLDRGWFGSATEHQDRLAGMLRQRVESGEPVI